LNRPTHPAACTCWTCDLARQKKRGLDTAIPPGQAAADAVVLDAEAILESRRETAESRGAKREKAKRARAAVKRQRGQKPPGGKRKRK
jgi:hypothetical protein